MILTQVCSLEYPINDGGNCAFYLVILNCLFVIIWIRAINFRVPWNCDCSSICSDVILKSVNKFSEPCSFLIPSETDPSAVNRLQVWSHLKWGSWSLLEIIRVIISVNIPGRPDAPNAMRKQRSRATYLDRRLPVVRLQIDKKMRMKKTRKWRRKRRRRRWRKKRRRQSIESKGEGRRRRRRRDRVKTETVDSWR